MVRQRKALLGSSIVRCDAQKLQPKASDGWNQKEAVHLGNVPSTSM